LNFHLNNPKQKWKSTLFTWATLQPMATVAQWAEAQHGGLWPAHADGAQLVGARRARCIVTTPERGQRTRRGAGLNSTVECCQR
jgi:hypothetical protein